MSLWLFLIIPAILIISLAVTFAVITFVNKRKVVVHIQDRNIQRVVFSLTSLPSRMSQLHETVYELLHSTIEPDAIYVNIPYECKRLNKKYIISAELMNLEKTDDRVIMNRCEDLGPATKLIPTLLRESDPNTLIITADDDIFYPKDYHEELLIHAIKEPNTAFGYRGVVFRKGNPIYVASYPGLTQIIEGFTGAIYRRKFFHEDVMKVPDNDCWFTDDIWISAHLAKHQIPRKLLPGEPHNVGMGRKGNPIKQKTNSKSDPLHVENHRRRNKGCYNYVQDLF